jgi:quercetin dioxygenase-like cupin family protein
MKTKIIPTLCVIMFVSILTFSCKETTTKADSTKEKTQSQVNVDNMDTMPVMDPALDPLIVGKEFSRVFSDTLNVQLYEFTMKPGDSVGLHQHLDHAVYVLEGGKLMVYINGTDPVVMDLQAGVGFVGGPLTDSAKNIGETNIKLLLTEIHRPRE